MKGTGNCFDIISYVESKYVLEKKEIGSSGESGWSSYSTTGATAENGVLSNRPATIGTHEK